MAAVQKSRVREPETRLRSRSNIIMARVLTSSAPGSSMWLEASESPDSPALLPSLLSRNLPSLSKWICTIGEAGQGLQLGTGSAATSAGRGDSRPPHQATVEGQGDGLEKRRLHFAQLLGGMRGQAVQRRQQRPEGLDGALSIAARPQEAAGVRLAQRLEQHTERPDPCHALCPLPAVAEVEDAPEEVLQEDGRLRRQGRVHRGAEPLDLGMDQVERAEEGRQCIQSDLWDGSREGRMENREVQLGHRAHSSFSTPIKKSPARHTQEGRDVSKGCSQVPGACWT